MGDISIPAAVALPASAATEPSIVFVTMHKAGSVFVDFVIDRLTRERGLVHVDFAAESFHAGRLEEEYCVERSPLFSHPGYYFGPFRGPYVDDLADLGDSRAVVQLRDPRDCLVSFYYSIKVSHPIPGEGELLEVFNSLRSAARETSVESYCLEKAVDYQNRLDVLERFLLRHPDALVLHYEEMVTDFPTWLSRLAGFIGVEPSLDARAEIEARATFKVVEDERQHVRQVTPGDFRRKLNPEAQAKVTRTLARGLARFGYLE